MLSVHFEIWNINHVTELFDLPGSPGDADEVVKFGNNSEEKLKTKRAWKPQVKNLAPFGRYFGMFSAVLVFTHKNWVGKEVASIIVVLWYW